MHTVLLASVLALLGAEVYRWVDANGVTHYSDTPHQGAQKIIIDVPPPAGTVRPTAAPSRPDDPVEPDANVYEQLAIESPSPDEVLWNIEGQMDVAVSVEPSLRPSHQLQLLLDGQVAAILPPGSTRTRLSEVFRGSHTLVAEVLDAGGQQLMRSQPVSFAVRQTSIANPVNPITQPIPQPRPARP